ncbi:hypothetical protein ACJ2A9_21210 [Anaerobacillus sp. MEB173]|uniref:hypothetical protein n=1 Tax=Anaerobacillus sp. MEB173 TaxID=3383345 RepID=UPI003F906087
MDRSKFGAFMIQCNKCSRGWSVSEEDLIKEKIICQDPECKSEFTIYEGIKNGLKKVEDHITPNFFLANNAYSLMVDIKIGYSAYVHLPEDIKKIYKIMLFPMGPFVSGATDITNNGFNLFTSLANDSDPSIVGDQGKVMAMIHFKSEDYEVPWLHLLQYAFDQLRSGEYLTSILLSEIALEAYVDSTLTIGYSEIGLDKDSISRLLVATEIPVKVNPLMNNLFEVKLASSASWKDWERKALKWRNGIAHGTKVTATKDEALTVYKTVVDSIFHFIEGVDNYRKKQGHTEGLFFRSK